MLKVERLGLSFQRDKLELPILHDISFQIRPGESLALVGESGCGKSITCLALTGLPPTDQARISGRILFGGTDLNRTSRRELRNLRRRRGIAYVFQDPGSGLNPVMRIRSHMRECGLKHGFHSRAIELLKQAGLPPRCLYSYPCELSGGQQQRVMIAMALAFHPRLLVADEPTTALDVITQRNILDLLQSTTGKNRTSLLLVTHNLGLVAGRADRAVIMYAGHIVESGPVHELLTRPRHPYTAGLLEATPSLYGTAQSLKPIPGVVPAPDSLPTGCPFHPRCPDAKRKCSTEKPPLLHVPRTDGQIRCWFPRNGPGARQPGKGETGPD